PPEGLNEPGQRFWNAVVTTWDLSVPELELLAAACRTIDEIDALQASVTAEGAVLEDSNGWPKPHPALVALRSSRSLLGKLLAQLELPDVDGEKIPSPLQARGKRAAHSRWAQRDQVAAQRARRGSA